MAAPAATTLNPIRVSGVQPPGIHGRLLIETWICVFPASFLLSIGQPGIAAKLIVGSLFGLLAYHFLMRQPFEFVALTMACLPMVTVLRGLFFYYSIILALGGGLIFFAAVMPKEPARLWSDLSWRVMFLWLVCYWWISFVRTGNYASNLRAFELILSLAATMLLAGRRSYLGTALLGFGISTAAVAIGLLPYGDRLGEGKIAGLEVGNPILLGLPSSLVLLLSIADSGKWLLLDRHKILRVAVSLGAGLCLALSASRGSWLATAVGLLIIFIWNKGGKKSLLVSLLVLSLGIAALLSTKRGSNVASYFTKTLDSERSLANRTSFRSVQWEVFPDVFWESPIWGWGPGSGVEVAGEFTGRHLGWHSMYLQLGGETGMIGLGSLIVLLVSLTLRGLSYQSRTGEMVPLIGLVIYMTIGLSVTGMDSTSGVFLGLAFASANVSPSLKVYRLQFAEATT
ncbi:MAG: O-antigen ligase family protein [Acidobacteriia bacterium]|nr:O-antigen ligase family protein [Terriglobia bacterium]